MVVVRSSRWVMDQGEIMKDDKRLAGLRRLRQLFSWGFAPKALCGVPESTYETGRRKPEFRTAEAGRRRTEGRDEIMKDEL